MGRSREIRLLTHSGLLLCALALGAAACSAKKSTSASQPALHLRGIGPRLISNQTSQPLAVYGDGFQSGMRLHLGAPFERDVAVAVLDKQHGYLRLSGLDMPPGTAEATVPVTISRLEGAQVTGEAKLTVVNDNQFPDLVSLVVSRA